jgi:hypothetical protein
LTKQPDQAKYSGTWDLDDVLSWLVEDYDKLPHDVMRKNFFCKDARTLARRRAVMALKLHGLFRSDCCRWMQRGVLYDDADKQHDHSSSYWGPMTALDDGSTCPEFVHLVLTQTKTTEVVEHRIGCLRSDAALCPVAALFTYVTMCKTQGDMAKSLSKTDSVFMGITKSKDNGVKCYTALLSSEPLAKDTLHIMTEAGISDIYKAHSLRGAVASRLLDKGVPELDIVHHARWSGTSVFRKYYERSRHKTLSTADLIKTSTKVPSAPVPSPATAEGSCTVDTTNTPAPAVVTAPAASAASLLEPRINYKYGPKNGLLRIPGQQTKSGVTFHCSCCWEKDDHTMIWCRSCNKHLHASCFSEPAAAEALHQGEGWLCAECS